MHQDNNRQITTGVERCCALSPALGSLIAALVRYLTTNALARRPRPGSLQASSDSSPVSERPRTTVSVGALHPVSSSNTRRHLRSANRHLLAVSGSTLTAVGRSQLLARWPGTHSRILSRIQRAAQTVLSVYLKRTCSRVTSASSALGVLNDYALYNTNPLTHSSKT